MKGNPALIEALNGLLADELAATNQYLAHYSAAANWGYAGLAALILDRANDERRHAAALVARILQFDGAVPSVASIGPVEFTVGDVPGALTFDAAAEVRAAEKYNAAIAVAVGAADNATRAILEPILAEETEHLNEIEALLRQIADTGLDNFLSTHTPKG